MLKPLLSKVNFWLNRTPEIETCAELGAFIPAGYKSVLLISADFELAWAWQYARGVESPLTLALEKARLERRNLPEIVKVCEKFDIPVTWATVGHLFLESCQRENTIAHKELPRPPHFENPYSRFSGNDWFAHDPCTDVNTDPEWYCPDLIRMILDSSVNHEIGCHTFSHINCADDSCPPEVLRAELQACRQIAQQWQIPLASFVHPGYSIGNLDILAKEGFTNFRTNDRNVLGYPRKHANGLWEFEQTAEFVYRKGWSIDYHIYRYKEIINRAIKSNTVCVIWFHPSFDPKVVDEILPEVFRYIDQRRHELFVTTHTEYINWINHPDEHTFNA